tara:strand:+ start:93728 stop:94180 length:453 start_codon:yes stop_codon:yes gene_type:complete
MANKSISEATSPAVLHFRGQNLEAMVAMQMRSLDVIRRMTNLMLDSTQTITERQTEFLRSSVDQMNAAYKKNDAAADPKEIFEQQAVVYQDLYESLSDHVAEIAKVTSTCCSKMAHEAAEVINDQTDDDNQKSCCAKTDDAAPKKHTVKK